MFEGRKAKRLGIRDLGTIKPYVDAEVIAGKLRHMIHSGPVCQVCHRKLRAGKSVERPVHWCPKCEIIIDVANGEKI